MPTDPRIIDVVKKYMKGRKRTAYLISRDGHSDLEATKIYTSYLGMDIDAGAYAKLKG